MARTLPREVYKGYSIVIRTAVAMENVPGEQVYEWLLHKPWPKFTNLTSDELYDSPQEALAAAKKTIDGMERNSSTTNE